MRFFWSFLLCIVATPLAVSPACACGALDLLCRGNQAADNWITQKTQDAGSGAAAGVVQQITPLVNQVMAQQLPSLVNQMNSAIDNNILTAQSAGDELVDHINQALNNSFIHLADFRDEFFSQLGNFRDQLFVEINSTLDQTFYQVYCLTINVANVPTELANTINSQLAKLEIWKRHKARSACYRELHINTNVDINNLNSLQAYSVAECVQENTQDLNTPSSTLAAQYGDLEKRASDLMCALRYDNTGRLIALEYWVDAGRIARIWFIASTHN
jgi:hypothetical protein